jgi:hypothetical protein
MPQVLTDPCYPHLRENRQVPGASATGKPCIFMCGILTIYSIIFKKTSMKNIVIAFLFSTVCIVCNAQVSVPTTPSVSSLTNFIKPPSIGDVGKTSTSIVSKLMSELSLPGSQKSPLTSAITGFLKKKEGIIGLAGSNPTSYLSKFTPMQSDLFSKMKGIIGESAFTKFLGLKPSGSGAAGNILSNLFF